MSEESKLLGTQWAGTKESILRICHQLRTLLSVFSGDRMGQAGVVILIGFLLIGVFGPTIAPYGVSEITREGGSVARLESPSLEHPFGTTNLGQDIFSQTLISARVSIVVGFLTAFVSVFIGTNIGLISGYFGGWTDDILMRITDLAYGIPLLPFIIVLVVLLGPGLFNMVLAISLVQWRSTARVVHAEVLSQRQRPYVVSAQAIGANDTRIMFRHILPNVLPLAFLYVALSVGWAIIAAASVSFLGFGDPSLYSYGQMLFEAYNSGVIRKAWWWVIPPGVSIMLLVISVFLISRSLEKLTNPEMRHRE